MYCVSDQCPAYGTSQCTDTCTKTCVEGGGNRGDLYLSLGTVLFGKGRLAAVPTVHGLAMKVV